MPLAGGWPNSEHLHPGDEHKHWKDAEESEVQPTNKWAVTTLSCVKNPNTTSRSTHTPPPKKTSQKKYFDLRISLNAVCPFV
jgi:hypothetical protein